MALSSRLLAAELVEMPPRAPRAAVAQDVGLTHISVEYRSPAVRGRRIWGERVAFGEPWQSGDSPQATIELSRDVTVEGARLRAGTYALVATPAPRAWSLAFEPVGGGTTVHVEVPVERAEPRERLRFAFSSFTPSSARLDLEWERVRVSLPIAVDTNGQILSAIAALDRHDPELGHDFARAGNVLLAKKGDETERRKGLAYLEHAAALGVALPGGGAPSRFEPAAEQPNAKRSDHPDHPGAPAAPFKPAVTAPVTEPAWGPAAGASLVSAAAISPGALPSSTARERTAPSAVKATRAPATAEIGPVVAKGRASIQTCYQRALRKDPSLARGRISVSISIGASGLVKSVVVEAPEGLRPVEPCVKAAITHWVFPPSTEAYATELPFVLDGRD